VVELARAGRTPAQLSRETTLPDGRLELEFSCDIQEDNTPSLALSAKSVPPARRGRANGRVSRQTKAADTPE
jgi:hypothetical protein